MSTFLSCILSPVKKIRQFIHENGWYQFLTLSVSGIASIAAVATAIVSWKTMDINMVERDEVATLQKEAVIQKQTLSNAIDRVDLYGDIIAAEGGDRMAYVSAITAIRHGHEEEGSKFLRRKIDEISMMFSADDANEYLKQRLSWPSPTRVDNIKKMLKHSESLQRFYAIQKAYELRCNSFIPDIMDIALSDRDLRVVQLATYVINKTFEDNMIFNVGPRCNLSLNECVEYPNEARNRFDKAWEVHKEKILGRKPKEYRYGKDKNPPHRQMMYLFDPEKPDNIPVLPE